MTKTKRKSTGICHNCNDDDSCTYPKDDKEPVIYCEGHNVPRPNPTPQRTPAKQSEQDNNYKGLCKNCENNKTCTMEKPEGGVWHCQEYR